MKKFFVIFAALALVAAALGFFREGEVHAPAPSLFATPAASEYRRAEVSFGETAFSALVADTEALRSRGLSGFSGIDEGEAMLFAFPTPGIWGFWMKDMLFAIDIVWLDEGYRVVHIESGVSPETYPKTFLPTSSSRYVVETRAGAAQASGIKIGDTARVSSI